MKKVKKKFLIRNNQGFENTVKAILNKFQEMLRLHPSQ